MISPTPTDLKIRSRILMAIAVLLIILVGILYALASSFNNQALQKVVERTERSEAGVLSPAPNLDTPEYQPEIYTLYSDSLSSLPVPLLSPDLSYSNLDYTQGCSPLTDLLTPVLDRYEFLSGHAWVVGFSPDGSSLLSCSDIDEAIDSHPGTDFSHPTGMMFVADGRTSNLYLAYVDQGTVTFDNLPAMFSQTDTSAKESLLRSIVDGHPSRPQSAPLDWQDMVMFFPFQQTPTQGTFFTAFDLALSGYETDLYIYSLSSDDASLLYPLISEVYPSIDQSSLHINPVVVTDQSSPNELAFFQGR